MQKLLDIGMLVRRPMIVAFCSKQKRNLWPCLVYQENIFEHPPHMVENGVAFLLQYP